MSLIDWSDPEEMCGLLLEYVADEASAAHDDRERRHFLQRLSRELTGRDCTAGSLLDLRATLDPEFAADPVVEHLDDCIAELQRIERAR